MTTNIQLECDQIMTDVDETGTGSLSTITTTPTLSYCPLSEDSYSDRQSTPGYQREVDFTVSPDLLTKNLLNTPRNRLSYQGDLRNKSLSNDRRSFQEIKFKNIQDNSHCVSFNNQKGKEQIKSDVSILTISPNCSPQKGGSMYEIVMGNNYERLGNKSSILHQEDSSYEEVMPSCKSSTDSIDLNFEIEKSVENIHYETLVVSSPESCNSSQREMSVSPQVMEID